MKPKASTLTIIFLIILLLLSVGINIQGWRHFKSWESFVAGSELDNIKYRTKYLVKLRTHVKNGNLEDSEAALNMLRIAEDNLLNVRQLPNNPEGIRNYAANLQSELEQAWVETETKR